MRGRLLALIAAALVVAAVVALVVVGGPLGSSDTRGAEVLDLEIDSAAVERRQPVSVLVPEGAKDAGRPLLVLLHGRGGDESSFLTQPFYDAVAALGDRAPVIAFPDGGDSSYWHDRETGGWGSYVIDEVIPEAIEVAGADPGRVAIGGVSMGGFGAFDLARLNPGSFCAAGGHSPALWVNGGESAPGAFDDAEDFAGHDLVAAAGSDPGGLSGPKLWLDTGDADPFVPGDDAFLAAAGQSGLEVSHHRAPGGHDRDYWDPRWERYLRFYTRALARCGTA